MKKNICIEPGGYFDHSTVFEGNNSIGRNTFLDGCYIGMGSYIASDSYLLKTRIGRYCSIGCRVTSAVGEHKIRSGFSSSPSFYSHNPANGLSFMEDTFDELKYIDSNNKYCISIENDVWIGAGVVLLSGITLRNGTIIGAGSVVTKDTEPYGIYVGNPAQKIGYRFSDDRIEDLLNSRWWDLDKDSLKEFSRKYGI